MLHIEQGKGRVCPVPFTFGPGGPVAFTDHTSRVQSRPPEPIDCDASTAEAAFLAEGDRVGHLEDRFDVGQRVRGVAGTLDAVLSTRQSRRRRRTRAS